MGKHGQHRALVAAAALAAMGSPAGAACRLALALGFDVSRSVSAVDYGIQRDGLVAALSAPEIRAAFLKPEDRVAFALFEWSGVGYQETVVGWTLVENAGGIDAIAAAIAAHVRGGEGQPTAIGAALVYGRDLLAERPECGSWTLDLSGDGRNNDGIGSERMYEREEFGDIVVNGLAIGGHEADIAEYYGGRVIRGPGAFVEVAHTHDGFPRAIRRKLERELAERVLGQAAAGGGGG